MTGTPTFTLVNMCGNEGAQVVAARLPSLLRKIVPGMALRDVGYQFFLDRLAGGSDGYIVMLPPEIPRARSAWHRFKRSLALPAPVLPVVVSDFDRFTRPYGCRGGTVGVEGREIDDQAVGRQPSRSGLRALPIVHIPPGDARIEHGGKFHLDPEAAALLVRRLQDLTSLSRDSAATDALTACSQCRCVPRAYE